MINKMKLHTLTHLPEDIRRFGPPGLYIVEGFEGWNRIWRLCSILSNHHSPSRDIAIKLCKAERIKHLLSGGFWYDQNSKTYVQAGMAVQQMFDSNEKLRRRLGWSQTPGPAPGTYTPPVEHRFSYPNSAVSNVGSVKLVPEKKQPSRCTWDELFNTGTIPLPRPDGVHAEDCLLLGKTVIATSGDICRIGSWVFYHSPFVRHLVFKVIAPFTHGPQGDRRVLDNGKESIHYPTMVGRIFKIVVTEPHREYVIMEAFNVSGARDGRYGMPTMHAGPDYTYQIIPPSVSFNLPHL